MPEPILLGGKTAQAKPTPQPVAPQPDTGAKPMYDHKMTVTEGNLNDAVGVETIENAVPGREFRGYCRKDGWQSYQPTKQLALDAALQHCKKYIVRTAAPASATKPAATPIKLESKTV